MKINENIEITNEDNMALMARYPDSFFDLAVVDPEYGINAAKEKFTPLNETWNGKKKVGYKSKDWDKKPPPPEYFKELFRVSKKQIVWGGNYFGLIGGYIFWDKKETMPTYTKGELAWVSFMTKIEKFEFLWSGYKKQVQEKRIHPTQKPKELYEWIFQNYAKENYKILDTHFGSGSIAVALDRVNKYDKLNLSLTACELDKEYYLDSIEWLKREMANLSLF